MLQHPGSIGAAQKHMIGHERFQDVSLSPAAAPANYRKDPITGDVLPLTQYRQLEASVLMPEFEGYFVYRAIMDGDLDYLETVHAPGTARERIEKDPSLLSATAKNRAARGCKEPDEAVKAKKAPASPAGAAKKIDSSEG